MCNYYLQFSKMSEGVAAFLTRRFFWLICSRQVVGVITNNNSRKRFFRSCLRLALGQDLPLVHSAKKWEQFFKSGNVCLLASTRNGPEGPTPTHPYVYVAHCICRVAPDDRLRKCIFCYAKIQCGLPQNAVTRLLCVGSLPFLCPGCIKGRCLIKSCNQ